MCDIVVASWQMRATEMTHLRVAKPFGEQKLCPIKTSLRQGWMNRECPGPEGRHHPFFGSLIKECPLSKALLSSEFSEFLLKEEEECELGWLGWDALKFWSTSLHTFSVRLWKPFLGTYS